MEAAMKTTFRTVFLGVVPILCALAVATIRADGAEYYTNWESVHLSGFPAESGPQDDPDLDSQINLLEFAFGTDPQSGTGSVTGLIFPHINDDTDSVFAVEILEQEGHESGIQIDLELSG